MVFFFFFFFFFQGSVRRRRRRGRSFFFSLDFIIINHHRLLSHRVSQQHELDAGHRGRPGLCCCCCCSDAADAVGPRGWRRGGCWDFFFFFFFFDGHCFFFLVSFFFRFFALSSLPARVLLQRRIDDDHRLPLLEQPPISALAHWLASIWRRREEERAKVKKGRRQRRRKKMKACSALSHSPSLFHSRCLFFLFLVGSDDCFRLQKINQRNAAASEEEAHFDGLPQPSLRSLPPHRQIRRQGLRAAAPARGLQGGRHRARAGAAQALCDAVGSRVFLPRLPVRVSVEQRGGFFLSLPTP